MGVGRVRHLFIIVVLSLFSTGLLAQKITLKSNLLHLTPTTPNVGLELGLSQRITLDLTHEIPSFTFENNKRWKHRIVPPKSRGYFCEHLYVHSLGLLVGGGGYNMSRVKIPITANTQTFRYKESTIRLNNETL